MSPRYGNIVGWGKYVPERVLTNADLERMVDTSDEWIVSRTGIRERRVVSEGETIPYCGGQPTHPLAIEEEN